MTLQEKLKIDILTIELFPWLEEAVIDGPDYSVAVGSADIFDYDDGQVLWLDYSNIIF
jgi:hypothetical protein